jgi:hypothetical protein
MESSQINLRDHVRAFAHDLLRSHPVDDHVAFIERLAAEMTSFASDVAADAADDDAAYDASLAFEQKWLAENPEA